MIVYFIGALLDGMTKIDLAMLVMGTTGMLKSKRFWFSVMLVSLYIFASYLMTSNVVKVILDFVSLAFCCYYLIKFNKKNFIQIVLVSFVIWVSMLLIDVLFSVLLLYILKFDLNYINSIPYFKVFLTSCVCFIMVLIFSNKKLRNGIYKVTNIDSYVKGYYVILIIILSVLLFSISVYICLFNYNIGIILSTLFIMITIYTIIVVRTINDFYQKNRIQSEYDILLKNLNEYENLLDLQRVTNHENKNQLLVIKGMIDKGESNTSEYINSIIDTQYKDNDAIIYKTNRIPSGGLRGLIYYKILTMKEKKINSNLDVDRSLNELDFDNIPIKTNQELCKIVGVFLDNAIQAVSELKKKEIDIYLKYENDELYIKVSNNYSGIIELDKIDNSGYTTKGKGHGYGLSLVKGIIRENDCFKNDREIHGKMFSQIIRLKINED